MLTRTKSSTSVVCVGVVIFEIFGWATIVRAEPSGITWDRGTLVLIARGGGYGRIIVDGNRLLCGYELGRRGIVVSSSADSGKTWTTGVAAARSEHGGAANPEMLLARSGRLLLFFNDRPRDGIHPYTIASVASTDHGTTWSTPKVIYTGGVKTNTRCYEPAAVQKADGTIDLFFANEFPHQDGSQEISVCRSTDDGITWDKPVAASYRKGCRDGMPVPLILAGSNRLVVAIEDNGLTPDHQLKPAVFEPGDKPVAGDDPHRWPAVDSPWPDKTYAGAPYIRQLSTGQTVLSCQSNFGHAHLHMAVYVGDRDGKHFSSVTEPFPTDDDADASWNSLLIKTGDVVSATSVTTIGGVRGLWSIDGHLPKP